MTEGTVPSIELCAGDAAIRFSKPNDRFEHRFCVQIDRRWVNLLGAHLHDPLAPWPTDPAIQQLVVEPIGNPPHLEVALGVGMSGHGHWSLACQWFATADSHPAIQLDYACKLQPPVDFLGSTYQIPKNLHAMGLTLDRVQATKRNWLGRFLVGELQTRYQLSIEAIEGNLHWDADRQEIQLLPSGTWEKPKTARWCYRIAWLSCHE